MPLCDALDCVHLHNEGFHRGFLSLRGPFGSSDIAGGVDPRASFCRLALIAKLCHLHTLLLFTCSDDFLSLSGPHHLLRNVIRTAVGCDSSSYS